VWSAVMAKLGASKERIPGDERASLRLPGKLSHVRHNASNQGIGKSRGSSRYLDFALATRRGEGWDKGRTVSRLFCTRATAAEMCSWSESRAGVTPRRLRARAHAPSRRHPTTGLWVRLNFPGVNCLFRPEFP
jgi:hypothetical protein